MQESDWKKIRAAISLTRKVLEQRGTIRIDSQGIIAVEWRNEITTQRDSDPVYLEGFVDGLIRAQSLGFDPDGFAEKPER